MNYQQSVFDGTENSTVEQSIRLIKEFEAIALHRNPLGYNANTDKTKFIEQIRV